MIRSNGKVLLFMFVLIAAGAILSGCGGKAAGETLPAGEGVGSEEGTAFASGLTEVLGGRGLMAYTSDDFVPLFEQAAAKAGVRDAVPQFYLLEGDPGTVLALVDWYGLAENYQFMVIEPNGSATFAGQTDRLATILDAQWLDDAWAVTTNVGSGMYVVQVYLVGQKDGRWVQLYPPKEGGEPLVSVPNWPMSYFADGYRSLTISYIDESEAGVSIDSPMVEYHFEWQDDHYVEIGGE
jgi:hypothetical protein